MSDRIPYVVWRNGRPRFVPGPRERRRGFKSQNLRHPGGTWFIESEAHEFSKRMTEEIRASRSEPEKRVLTLARRAIVQGSDGRMNSKKGYVYFSFSGRQVKIGFSTNPFRRALQLKTGMPMGVTAFATVAGSPTDEKHLHRVLRKDRLHGEWFVATELVLKVVTVALAAGRVVIEPKP